MRNERMYGGQWVEGLSLSRDEVRELQWMLNLMSRVSLPLGDGALVFSTTLGQHKNDMTYPSIRASLIYLAFRPRPLT
jgi:hypothetical protein